MVNVILLCDSQSFKTTRRSDRAKVHFCPTDGFVGSDLMDGHFVLLLFSSAALLQLNSGWKTQLTVKVKSLPDQSVNLKCNRPPATLMKN